MNEKPSARIEQTIVLEFRLPGVRQSSSSNVGGSSYQLESRGYGWSEGHVLHVNRENARETAAVLRELAEIIEARLKEFG